MILAISVTEYRYKIAPHELGLVRDTHTAKRLRQVYAPGWFKSRSVYPWKVDLNAPPGFQSQVDKYAEVVTQNPWNDVELYFTRFAKASGLATGPGILHYPGRYPILNSAAMAAAAEGIAGWYCRERYGWEFVARPPRVTPDLIFRERATKRYALVEVKSSGRSGDIKKKLVTEMMKLLRILNSSKQLRPGAYYAGIIMVQVAGANDVRLTGLILEPVMN
jgi:hypothetical protein